MKTILVAFALVLALAACGAAQKKDVMEPLVANDTQRAQTFEATLRLLDQHPEWVDELYARARAHPPTFHRFLVNTTRDLKDEALARETAQLLVANPPSLEEVMVQTMDAAKPSGDARAALDRAMHARAATVTDVMTDSPATLVATMDDTVKMAQAKPDARAAFLQSMRESAPRIAELLAHDPKTMGVMTEALLGQAVHDRPALDATLKKLGIEPKK